MTNIFLKLLKFTFYGICYFLLVGTFSNGKSNSFVIVFAPALIIYLFIKIKTKIFSKPKIVNVEDGELKKDFVNESTVNFTKKYPADTWIFKGTHIFYNDNQRVLSKSTLENFQAIYQNSFARPFFGKRLNIIEESSENLEKSFVVFVNSINAMFKSKEKYFAINSTSFTRAESKFNGGATETFLSEKIYSSRKIPKKIKADKKSLKIYSDNRAIYFFKTIIIFETKNSTIVTDYFNLMMLLKKKKITGFGPRDSIVVDKTWEKVNKSGEPDLRFKENRVLDIYLMESLEFIFFSNVAYEIRFSKEGCTRDLLSILNSHKDELRRLSSKDEEEELQKDVEQEVDDDKLWHEVLGISKNSSKEEIKKAYQIMMSQYHPDKVASLGPELIKLAESKAKEINAAYKAAVHASSEV